METSKENIKDNIKFVLIITPAISIFLASLYYYILLSGDGPLSPKILTISDHFDKATEFIIPVFLVHGVAFFGGFVSGTLHEDYRYKRKKELNRFQRFCSNANKILIAMLLSTVAVGILPYEITAIIAFELLIIFSPFLILKLYFKLNGRQLLKLEHWKYKAVLSLFLISLIAGDAYEDKLKIRFTTKTVKSIEDVVFYDKLSNGYLIGQNGNLEYHSKTNETVITNKLKPFSSKTILCLVKIDKRCRVKKTS